MKPLSHSTAKKKLKFSKEKKVFISKLKKRAWELFSQWVRRSAINKRGLVRCVTCGREKEYKKMQSGHFIPGRHGAVLFDERGVHPQDYTCNVILGGNGPKYYEYMLKFYGQEVIDDLERLDKINKQFKPHELEAIITEYTEKLKELSDPLYQTMVDDQIIQG